MPTGSCSCWSSSWKTRCCIAHAAARCSWGRWSNRATRDQVSESTSWTKDLGSPSMSDRAFSSASIGPGEPRRTRRESGWGSPSPSGSRSSTRPRLASPTTRRPAACFRCGCRESACSTHKTLETRTRGVASCRRSDGTGAPHMALDTYASATLEAALPRRARVVVVDDHLLTRAGLRAVLADDPEFELVGEAINGDEGVALSRALRPDL